MGILVQLLTLPESFQISEISRNSGKMRENRKFSISKPAHGGPYSELLRAGFEGRSNEHGRHKRSDNKQRTNQVT